jgi:Peptidase family S41
VAGNSAVAQVRRSRLLTAPWLWTRRCGRCRDAARAAFQIAELVEHEQRMIAGGVITLTRSMVAFITSYLFGPQPVHLNDFYDRPQNETRQSWTLPYVPGKRLTNKDVYILTISRTFSGAEEFIYNLKHLKRATVVGENTGGGAHLVDERQTQRSFHHRRAEWASD